MLTQTALLPATDDTTLMVVVPVRRSSRAAREAVRRALLEAGVPAGVPVQQRTRLEVPIAEEAVVPPVTEARCRSAVEAVVIVVHPLTHTARDIVALAMLPGIGGAYRGAGNETSLVTPTELAEVLLEWPRPSTCWRTHNGMAYLHGDMGVHGFDAEGTLAAVAALPNAVDVLRVIGKMDGAETAPPSARASRPPCGRRSR
jgi:hypothetical protein